MVHAHNKRSAKITKKILAGNPDASGPGYQTPAKAYGADLVLEINGVERQNA